MSKYYDRENVLWTLQGFFPVEFAALEHPYYRLIDSKLQAFRSERHWVLVLELIAYEVHQGDIINSISMVGNGVLNMTSTLGLEGLVQNFREVFTWEKDYSYPHLHPQAEVLQIKGLSFKIPHQRSYYTDQGIQLKHPTVLYCFEVLRGMLPQIQSALFCPADQLRLNMQEDLEKVLDLKEWHHPAPEDDIFESESMQMIAAVLETGEVSLYQPTWPPNNHWSNWEDIEGY